MLGANGVCTACCSVVAAPVSGVIPVGSGVWNVPPRKPTPRSTRPATLTSLRISGSAGAPGVVSTPSGPVSQLAVVVLLAPRLASVFVAGVRFGVSDTLAKRKSSVAPGPGPGNPLVPSTIDDVDGTGMRPVG